MKIFLLKKSLIISLTAVLFLFVLVFIYSCFRSMNKNVSELPLDENVKVVQTFLEGKGYKIISYSGKREYVLTKESLINKVDVRTVWELQNVNPLDFIGNEVRIDTFIVRNHPLDNLINTIKLFLLYKSDVKHERKTSVSVITVDGNIIGGVSNMITVPNLQGGLYSLDGKTLEEINGIPYDKWRNEWNMKFSLQ